MCGGGLCPEAAGWAVRSVARHRIQTRLPTLTETAFWGQGRGGPASLAGSCEDALTGRT